MGRISEVYHKDLKDTIYQICGRQDEQWEMISATYFSTALVFSEEEGMMQQSSVSISLSF